MKKLEEEVKKNSELAEKLIPALLKNNRNKWILFLEGHEPLIFNDFGVAVKKGLMLYGETAGFCVMKITDEEIKIPSCGIGK